MSLCCGHLNAARLGMPHEGLGHGAVGLDRKDVLVDIVEHNPHRSIAALFPAFDVFSQAVVERLHLVFQPVVGLRY